jgi:hypothetical protein
MTVDAVLRDEVSGASSTIVARADVDELVAVLRAALLPAELTTPESSGYALAAGQPSPTTCPPS